MRKLSLQESGDLMKWYVHGKTDHEICGLTGHCIATVRTWRGSKPPNREHEDPLLRARRNRYVARLTDEEIASIEGVLPGAIRTWRSRNGLPRLDSLTRNWCDLYAIYEYWYELAHTDDVIAALAGVTKKRVQRWRWSLALPPNDGPLRVASVYWTLYHHGFSDRAIAKITDTPWHEVTTWRLKLDFEGHDKHAIA